MQKFGKIINGVLYVPQNYPGSIEVEGKTVHNPTQEELLVAGYLPIEETQPEERDGMVAVATYAVNKAKTKIVQSWVYSEEAPADMQDVDVEPAAE